MTSGEIVGVGGDLRLRGGQRCEDRPGGLSLCQGLSRLAPQPGDVRQPEVSPAQVGLGPGIVLPLVHQLLIELPRRLQQLLPQLDHVRLVQQAVLADPGQVAIHSLTGQRVVPLGLCQVGLGLLPALLTQRIGSFQQRGADGQAGRRQHQQHCRGGNDRLVPLAPFHAPLGQGGTAGGDGPTLEEPPQVVGQLLGRRVAVLRLLGHRLVDDGLEVGGNRGVELAQRRRLVLGNLAEELAAVGAVEGRLQGQELVEGHAQRVDVGPAVEQHVLARGLLRAHIPQGPDDAAAERDQRVTLDLRQAEVGDPELAPVVHQQVGRLDVAVQDPALVGVVEGLGRLDAQPGHARK